MPGGAPRAQPPGIERGQKSANVIPLCVPEILPASAQETAKASKVALIVRDAISGEALLNPRVIEVIMNFTEPGRKPWAGLAALGRSPHSHYTRRRGGTIVARHAVVRLGFSLAGHFGHFTSGGGPRKAERQPGSVLI